MERCGRPARPRNADADNLVQIIFDDKGINERDGGAFCPSCLGTHGDTENGRPTGAEAGQQGEGMVNSESARKPAKTGGTG